MNKKAGEKPVEPVPSGTGSKIRLFLILLGCLIAAPSLLVQTAQADRAQQQVEKEKEKKPKYIVITNDDLPKRTPKETTKENTPQKTNAGDAEKKPPKGRTVKEKKEEKVKVDPKTTKEYWQEAKARLVKNIREIKEKLNEMDNRLGHLRTQSEIEQRHTEFLRIKEEMKTLFENVANFKRGLVSLEEELAELPNKARRAGVPPGWLR